MVIPRLVRQALAGEPLTVYGDGGQSRCFCHVSDVVGALVGLLDSDAACGEVFNVGSSEEVTILELAQRIVERTGSSSEIILVPYEDAYPVGFEDMQRRVPDTRKIEALIGWRPTLTLARIIRDATADASRDSTREDGASAASETILDLEALAAVGGASALSQSDR